MKNFIKMISLAGSALAAMSASQVQAQDASADEAQDTQLEEIIVTAQRTESNLQRTPVAVTSFSADALEEKGSRSLIDLGGSTPGLVVSTRSLGGAGQGGLAVRGIGVDATASGAAVGVYIDDVYYAGNSGNLLGFFDIERVEVLRGPQGTLFGRNTIAGAVQYVSVKPSTEGVSGLVEASGASVNSHTGSYRAAGAINLPLGSNLALRASAQYEKKGGYVFDRLNSTWRGQEEATQERLALRWTPSSDLTIDLKGENLHQTNNSRALEIQGTTPSPLFSQFGFLSGAPTGLPGPGVGPHAPPFTSLYDLFYNGALGNLLAAGVPFATAVAQANGAATQAAGGFAVLRPVAETRPFPVDIVDTPGSYSTSGYNGAVGFELDFRTVQGVVNWDVSDNISLKSISAYSYTKFTQLDDVDSTPLGILAVTRGLTTIKLFTQEVKLTGNSFGDHFNWTLGGYYYDSKQTEDGFAVFFGPSGFAQPQNGGDTSLDTKAYAFYGQGTVKFTDQLSATVGMRYSHEEIDGRFLNTLLPGPFCTPPGANLCALPVPAGAPFNTSFNSFTPHVGINFQANDDLLVYAKASKGFRAGGITLNASLAGGGLAFDPETAWTYEAGVRLQALDGRLRFNPTIFQTDWSNIQFNKTIPAGGTIVPTTQNAGDARIRGIELETQFKATPNLLLSATLSTLDAEYTRVSGVTSAAGVPLALSDDLQHAPKLKYSLGARYTIPVGNDGQVNLSANWAWSAKERSQTVDSVTQPSNGLLAARIEFTPGGDRFTFALYGTNLTNEYYYTSGTNGLANFGTIQADIGRPREIGASAKIKF